jgi:xylulokinase
MLDAAGIPLEMLPEVAQPYAIAGTLRPLSAHALGLSAGVPVAVGAGDDIEVLGYGLITHGQTMEHIGTTGSMFTVADAPLWDPTMGFDVYPHAVPDLWVVGGSTTVAGAALRWATQTLQLPDSDRLSECLSNPERVGLDDVPIFYPHLAGERNPTYRPWARGVWSDLSLKVDRSAIMRSVLEGVAYSLKSLLEKLETLAGPQLQIHVSSDNSDPSWVQLRADVYERPLLVAPEPTAVGAMLLAAVAVGISQDVATAVQMAVRYSSVISPIPDRASTYRYRYDHYLRLASAMDSLWHEFEAIVQ